jgi:hypothetical protein
MPARCRARRTRADGDTPAHRAITIEDAKQVFGADQVHLRPITFCERRPSGLTHMNRRSVVCQLWTITVVSMQICLICAGI